MFNIILFILSLSDEHVVIIIIIYNILPIFICKKSYYNIDWYNFLCIHHMVLLPYKILDMSSLHRNIHSFGDRRHKESLIELQDERFGTLKYEINQFNLLTWECLELFEGDQDKLLHDWALFPVHYPSNSYSLHYSEEILEELRLWFFQPMIQRFVHFSEPSYSF